MQVLDELLPKATGRDARVEKKRVRAEQRREREVSPGTVEPLIEDLQNIIGGASAATVRSSRSRFAIDICLVRANRTEHAQQRSSPWRRPLTVKDQAARARRSVEKTGRCAREEVCSSLLGKLASPCLCIIGI